MNAAPSMCAASLPFLLRRISRTPSANSDVIATTAKTTDSPAQWRTPQATQLDSPIYTANHEIARRRKRLRIAAFDEVSARDKITSCDAAIKPTMSDMSQTRLTARRRDSSAA
jgi:hypothetical protein